MMAATLLPPAADLTARLAALAGGFDLGSKSWLPAAALSPSSLGATPRALTLTQAFDEGKTLHGLADTGFKFKPRTERLNWRLLHSLDLGRVVREGDVVTLQTFLDNLTYSDFDQDDIGRMRPEDIVKVVKLSQLCMEFLGTMCDSSQQLLERLSEIVRSQAWQLKDAEQRAADLQRLQLLAVQRQPEAPPVAPPLEQTPRQTASPASPLAAARLASRNCKFCHKRFADDNCLHEHTLKRHMREFLKEKSRTARKPAPVVPPVDLSAAAPQPAPVASPSMASTMAPPTARSAALAAPASARTSLCSARSSAASVQVAEALHGATSDFQDHLHSLQRNLGETLKSVREDVERITSDAVRVAGGLAALGRPDGGAPASHAAPVAPVVLPMAPAACASALLLGSASDENSSADASSEVTVFVEQAARDAALSFKASSEQLEQKLSASISKRLEEREQALLARVEALAASLAKDTDAAAGAASAAAAGAEAAQRPGDGPFPEASAAAKAFLQEHLNSVMSKSVEEMRRFQEVVSHDLENSSRRVEELTRSAMLMLAQNTHSIEASPSSPEASALASMVDARSPLAKAATGARTGARSGSDASSRAASSGSSKRSASTSARSSPKPQRRAAEEGKRPMLPLPAKVQEDTGASLWEQVDLGGSAASPRFQEELRRGLMELETEEEKLRFMISMSGERTRPRRRAGKRATKFEKGWSQALASEDAAEIGAPKVAEPPPQEQTASSRSGRMFGRMGTSPSRSASAAKSEEEERRARLMRQALAGGLGGFLGRCGKTRGLPPPPRRQRTSWPAAPVPPLPVNTGYAPVPELPQAQTRPFLQRGRTAPVTGRDDSPVADAQPLLHRGASAPLPTHAPMDAPPPLPSPLVATPRSSPGGSFLSRLRRGALSLPWPQQQQQQPPAPQLDTGWQQQHDVWQQQQQHDVWQQQQQQQMWQQSWPQQEFQQQPPQPQLLQQFPQHVQQQASMWQLQQHAAQQQQQQQQQLQQQQLQQQWLMQQQRQFQPHQFQQARAEGGFFGNRPASPFGSFGPLGGGAGGAFPAAPPSPQHRASSLQLPSASLGLGIGEHTLGSGSLTPVDEATLDDNSSIGSAGYRMREIPDEEGPVISSTCVSPAPELREDDGSDQDSENMDDIAPLRSDMVGGINVDAAFSKMRSPMHAAHMNIEGSSVYGGGPPPMFAMSGGSEVAQMRPVAGIPAGAGYADDEAQPLGSPRGPMAWSRATLGFGERGGGSWGSAAASSSSSSPGLGGLPPDLAEGRRLFGPTKDFGPSSSASTGPPWASPASPSWGHGAAGMLPLVHRSGALPPTREDDADGMVDEVVAE